jgi:hypothetical protein
VVKTEDETVLHCTPREVGGGAVPRQTCWVLADSNGTEHIGPQYVGFTSMSEVSRIVNDWWKVRKERAQTPVP